MEKIGISFATPSFLNLAKVNYVNICVKSIFYIICMKYIFYIKCIKYIIHIFYINYIK